MIKVNVKYEQNKTSSCDNCNREMQVIINYEFIDIKPNNDYHKFFKICKPYVELHLCEDCSCALSNLHHNVMENFEPHQYYLDEITKC